MTKSRQVTSTHGLHGQTYPHTYLWMGAQVLEELTPDDGQARRFKLLASLLLQYLAFEGYLNWVGPAVCPHAWEDERHTFSRGKYTGTLGKVRLLATTMGIQPHFKKRPYSTVAQIDTWRDALVHSRPERLRGRHKSKVVDTRRVLPTVFRLPTRAFVDRARQDIWQLCTDLHTAAAERFEATGIHTSSPFSMLGWHQVL